MKTMRSGKGWQVARCGGGFTLIELLVTISIIAVLAGITVGGMRHVSSKSRESRLRAELDQLLTAIESYKEALGTYPPTGQPAPQQSGEVLPDAARNALFYELTGMVVDPAAAGGRGAFYSKDRSAVITVEQAGEHFSLDGFANATDDPARVRSFLQPRERQYAELSANVVVLVASAPWVAFPGVQPPIAAKPTMNPWRYLSPDYATNNPGGYDLWVDYRDGKVLKRMGNWTRTPMILK